MTFWVIATEMFLAPQTYNIYCVARHRSLLTPYSSLNTWSKKMERCTADKVLVLHIGDQSLVEIYWWKENKYHGTRETEEWVKCLSWMWCHIWPPKPQQKQSLNTPLSSTRCGPKIKIYLGQKSKMFSQRYTWEINKPIL